MSFILDALRKSEHERQINAGQNTGLLYQIEIKRNHNPWLIPSVIAMLAVILIILVWQIWLLPNPADTAILNRDHEMAAGSQPQTGSQERISASKPKNDKHTPENVQNKTHPANDDNRLIARPVPLESMHGAKQSGVTDGNKPKQVSADPLKDLPPLNIAGYIHNEQSGTVAMINNQLVHEGDELYPGLRLIKILDNSAIFSYRGYVFTR